MTKKQKILFLNPPGRRVYLRDYFCSKVSQADYINHPIDFVYLSGFLKESYDLTLIDAIVENLNVSRCLKKIQQIQPDIIVGLIGSVSYAEDVPFYKQVSKQLRAELILIGDILIERREERLQNMPFVNAFLHDFSTDDLLKYLQKKRDDLDGLKNMTIRAEATVYPAPIERPKGQQLKLPVPEHRLFLNKGYRYPFVRHRQFATLMTEFGCPYRCTFCIMSTLGWKIRTVENVMTELDLLSSLNIRELFFIDQTFGIQKDRAQELLQNMARSRYGFGWVCFSRPDILDEQSLTWMKAAGCHTIILGLESGSQQILDAVKKDYTKEEVKAGFQLCTSHGIRTVATVILGLPEESQDTFEETMDFLKELDPDFASFNVAVPRMGTPIRETALELGLIDHDFQIMDQSGHEVAMPTMTLSRQQIAAIKRRAIRDFYFNFRYFRKRLDQLTFPKNGAWNDLKIQLRQGWSLLRNYLLS